jgi:hypothetical protein
MGGLWSLPLMPEWYLVVGVFGVLSLLGLLWAPLLLILPLLLIAVGAPLAQAALSAANARFGTLERYDGIRMRALTMLLHLLQPLARLLGRLRYGLTPWRYGGLGIAPPWPHNTATWSEHWQALHQRLLALEEALKGEGASVARGGDFDRWDLEVRGGLFGGARLRMAVEEHGAGKQMVRPRSWPRLWAPGVGLALLFGMGAIMAALGQAWIASLVLGSIAVLVTLRTLQECASAAAFFRYAASSAERWNVGTAERRRT